MRNRFDSESAVAKSALLQHLFASPPRSVRDIVRLHDDLLFLRAFPDSAGVATLAREGLNRVGNWLRRANAHGSLDDSGIASSTSRHTFPFAIAQWLVRSFPREVSLDWRELDDTTHLDTLLRTFLTRAEEDAFDAGELSTREWLRMAVPPAAASDLAWIIENGLAQRQTRALFASLYDSDSLPVVWRLGGSRSPGSTTHNELADIVPAYRHGMRSTPADPLRHIASPLPSIALLPRSRALAVIDVARAALTARCREVFAISNPNADEVWLADLGEGATLAIVGTQPDLRMSLESNYGYLLMSNGVPIGYGGVTPLWNQANTGINIFDPFRGSEAGFLWAQMLRAFRQLFGVRRFVVNGYQFGEGNAEAISSGAYWFYYRLGFRPADPAQALLAAQEAAQLQRDRSYRSSAHTLRALAHGDLHLTLPGYRESTFIAEDLLQVCAKKVTERLAADPSASRGSAINACVERVRRMLNVRSMSRWPAAERQAFVRFAPVLDLLPTLDSWPASDKEGLVAVARSKGSAQERDFVLKARLHRQFWPTLRRALTSKT
ncbi:MAG: hypothetical protein U0132_04545 [Gemmatimonadaceae bacterium]